MRVIARPICISAALIFSVQHACSAQSDFRSVKWTLAPNDDRVHFRHRAVSEDSLSFERFQLVSETDFLRTQIRSDHPASLPLEEFMATASVNSSKTGVQLGLLLVFPGQIDPRTGTALVTSIPGETSKRAGEWEQLSVRGSPDAVRTQIRRLRTELHGNPISTDNAYIAGCVLSIELHRGATFVDVGEITYGPVVPADVTHHDPGTASSLSDSLHHIPVRIERSDVLFNSEPRFLTFIPDHGETAEHIVRLGMNSVWVANPRDRHRINSLVNAGLVVMATPPHPQFDPADYSAPIQGLAPLNNQYELVSMWYMGTRVGRSQMPHLMGWAREVRSADRELRRPIVADVIEGEGVASREIDAVGLGQHVLGRSTTFGEDRNRSYRRLRASAQLTMRWTWLQTEPAQSMVSWRHAAGYRPISIEPEQILMQLVAALSSGTRGVGYWKTDSFDRTPEIEAAVELANIYIQILEPFLVNGRIDGHIPIQTPQSGGNSHQTANESWIVSALNGRQSTATARNGIGPDGPDAAVLTAGRNTLIIAGFWDEASQFVPQSTFSKEATFTVAAAETASAWQISATGRRGLARNPTAGGLLIRLHGFEQFSFILLSTDPNEAAKLENRILEFAGRAAEIQLRIAELKLERIYATCGQIDQQQPRPDSVDAAFSAVEQSLRRSRTELDQQRWTHSERSSLAALRLLRGIQGVYWRAAIRHLPSPTASPHTVSFESLPDHWRLMAAVGSQEDAASNLVPSGAFDNLRLIENGGWRKAIDAAEGSRATADIVADRNSDNRYLRIAAWGPSSASARIPAPAVVVEAPTVDVDAGDIMEITGKIRLGQTIQAESDTPFFCFDHELGPEFSVYPTLESSWRTFRIYRHAAVSGPWKCSFGITGSAEVHLDDVAIRRVGTMSGGRESPNRVDGLPQQTTTGSRVQGAGYSIMSLP